MVEHCGGLKTDGDYVHTLTLTDIASGWTECVAMRVRDQMLVIEALEKVAVELPFAMLGIDSDNDSTFVSQAVYDYCKGRGLEQTRSRAYKKNDQAWVADDIVVADHERLTDKARPVRLGALRPACAEEAGSVAQRSPFTDLPEALQRLRRGLGVASAPLRPGRIHPVRGLCVPSSAEVRTAFLSKMLAHCL